MATDAADTNHVYAVAGVYTNNWWQSQTRPGVTSDGNFALSADGSNII